MLRRAAIKKPKKKNIVFDSPLSEVVCEYVHNEYGQNKQFDFVFK